MDDASNITNNNSSSSSASSDDYEWSPRRGLMHQQPKGLSSSSSESDSANSSESEWYTTAKRPRTAVETERFVQPCQSLSQLCQSYILMHWEKFPIGYLSLLPLSERKKLLYKLPIADVCILESLENTEFIKGIDMKAFWSSMSNFEVVEDSDIFVKEWGAAKFAREVFYACIIRNAFDDCVLRELFVSTPCGEESTGIHLDSVEELVKFLYAIRNLSNANVYFIHSCNMSFFIPSRFQKVAKLHKKDCIDAIVDCFRGEFPKIISGLLIETFTELEFQRIPHLLFDLRYLSINEVDFRSSEDNSRDSNNSTESFEFVQKVVNVAANLEVVKLYVGTPVRNPPLFRRSLDEFCVSLASHPSFWSKFRQLKFFSSTYGYVVSQSNFNKLISAYLSAPTDHAQELQFSSTQIEVLSMRSKPKFDQNYLHFKSIKLRNCKFQKRRADSESVSTWLGQSIDVLQYEEHRKTLLFKVKNSNTSVRKKKCRILDSDDEN